MLRIFKGIPSCYMLLHARTRLPSPTFQQSGPKRQLNEAELKISARTEGYKRLYRGQNADYGENMTFFVP